MTPTTLDRRGITWGAIAVAIALVLVVFGSAGLRWFDAALVGYLFGTLFAIFGVTYRYAVWLRRPPTAKLRPTRLAGAAAPGPARRERAHDPGPRRRQPLGPDVHRSSFAGPVGSRTSSCSGVASSPRSSRSRSCSAGCTSSRSGRTPREYRAYVANWGTVSFDSRSIVRLDHLPPARHRGGARPRGRVHVPRPTAPRSRRAGGRAQQRLPRAGRAVRGVGDGA